MARLPRFLLLSAGIGLSISLSLRDLEAQEEREVEPIQPSIFFEALNFVADDTAKSRVDFNFNIPYDFFVFVRSESNLSDFIARGEISVEILDSRDLSVAHDIIHKELHYGESAAPLGKSRAAVQGSFSFTLQPGIYHSIFEVNDLESRRGIVDRDRQITLKRFSDSAQVFSNILFLDQLEIRNDSLVGAYPVNLGGDAIFGKKFTLFFQSTGDRDSAGTVHYSIHKLDPTNKRLIVLEDSVKSDPRLTNRRLEKPEGDSILSYSLQPSRSGPRVNTYLVEIRGDTLQWGRYDVEVKSLGKVVSRKSFAIRWLDMPRTLTNIKLAVEALKYLMSEKEFEEFMKLSDDDMKKQFEIFWKKRDPTPSTAYNEEMAEYYQRCDYALENFRTLSHADGIDTDRGKVYILYGPPTKTDRLLTPNAPPKEVWYYENLQLKFVFIDESRSGNYKLLSSEKS
ncbi:MAG: GWxTD domain-containing protein [Bacteroidota bacterium]